MVKMVLCGLLVVSGVFTFNLINDDKEINPDIHIEEVIVEEDIIIEDDENGNEESEDEGDVELYGGHCPNGGCW